MTSRLAYLSSLGQRLSTAPRLDQVWSRALAAAIELLEADAGAWIWSTPETEAEIYQAPSDLASSPDADWWFDLLAGVGHPDAPVHVAGENDGTAFVDYLITPLVAEPWCGWLALARESGVFLDGDVDLASAVGEMTRLAALNILSRQHIETTRARQILEIKELHQMGQLIGESVDLQETLQEVLGHLHALVPYDGGEITLYDADDDVLVRRAYYVGDGANHVAESLGAIYQTDEGLTGWLVDHQQSLLIDDLHTFAEVEPKSVLLRQWASAYLGVPLLARNALVGTLEIAAVDAGHFSDHDKELAELFANQIAVAIENLRFYNQTDDELHRRYQAMAALQRVTREITSTIDLNYILHVVLDEVMHFSAAQAGLVAMMADQAFELRAQQGYGDDAGKATASFLDALQPGFEVYDRLAQEETVHILDAAHPDDDAQAALVACLASYLPGARTILITPVFYEQRLAGFILLQSGRAHAFGSAIVEFIEGLAIQTSIAVGNARRYQEQLRRGELMHQRAEQMSLLLEMSRTMRTDRSLEDVLLDVAYAVQEGTGFDIVSIIVLEKDELHRVASAGIPLVQMEKRREVPLPWERIEALCQDRFRIGQCYYIPHQYRSLTEDLDVFTPDEIESRDGEGAWHLDDIFFVPLRGSGGEVVGVLSLDRPRDGLAPTAMTSEVVEIFASQVALAIENNRLVESLRRQVTTLQLFNELNRSITTKLDLPLVLNTVVQSVTNLLEYDFSTVFLRDRSERAFVPLASSGYALDLLTETPLDVDGSFIAEVVKTGMPLVVEDVQADERFDVLRVPVGSSIVVPLMVDGESVGVLTADRKAVGDFSPTEVATMSALADQVTVAVENARLFEEVTRFNEELEARVAERTQELAEALEHLRFQRDRSEVLYHIASELVASLDMDRVLSQALMLLQRAVKASRSSVILLDNNTGQLFYRAAIGHTEPIPPGGKLAPFGRTEGVVGWVLQKREALIIPDATTETRFSFTGLEPTRSVMAVPVLGNAGEALGVILLQSSLVNVFDETQMRLVEAAAIQLGNALNNAELYGLIREQAERLGAMLRSQQIDAAKNQAILEGIADGVMVTDADGHVMLFNAAAERILSITRTQAMGRSQDEILGLYGSEAQDWLSRIEVWRRDSDSRDEAFLEHRLEVGRKFVSIHLSPVVGSRDEFLGVVSVFRDITSEIEADRAKSEFVSTVSHELRTPMTSIVGYVDLLINGVVGPLTEPQLGFLSKVKNNAERLTALVNDLLDISRIEQGRVELQLQAVSIETLVEQVMDLVHPKIEEKQQVLDAVIPEDLPQIQGDPDRMTQILVNIVSNAYKYTPAGGAITLYAYVRAGMVHVAVKDTGIGIAPDNQKKIFERFYRVEDDPAVYEVSGTGLGLAITLSLIQMHGGDIWLESELGEGSIFTFSVPLAEGEPEDDVGEIPASLVSSSIPTVLVVEDDKEIATLLKVTLEAENMKVLTAFSGEDALRIARQKLPDFISLDIRLPDLDGLEVLQLLKREPETADIPVVIVSVVADRARGLELGALDYLNKPLDEQKLLAIIKSTLHRRGVVVVADSDKEVLNKMRSALQTKGIGVRTTMRGERALLLARELQPSALILDLDLMDLNGYELLDRLKRNQRTAGIPVVMTTARDEFEDDKVRLQAFDEVRFMPKPFSIEALASDISNIINENGRGKES